MSIIPFPKLEPSLDIDFEKRDRMFTPCPLFLARHWTCYELKLMYNRAVTEGREHTADVLFRAFNDRCELLGNTGLCTLECKRGPSYVTD